MPPSISPSVTCGIKICVTICILRKDKGEEEVEQKSEGCAHSSAVLTDSTNASQLEDVRRHIQGLADKGVIRQSLSPYATPIGIVRKDGSIHLCVDYQKLDAFTMRDAFPLSRIDESIDAIDGDGFFSTLDLASGYHQVAIHEDDQEKTAFNTPFARMPFGISGAPATFHRLMQSSINHLILSSGLPWVHGRCDFDERLKRLNTVFESLREIGLKLNPDKCRFGAREARYLGHGISKKGIATDPDKIATVNNWGTPKTTRELRSLLGLARFVFGLAEIVRPLYQVTARANADHGHHLKRSVSIARYWDQECHI
ncbi:Pol polyprotein [Elysia marginata]|uniref:Pol polyprotein n=1 Tax=Elysia marginata TaxID=1093978 RepID=A0AAV4IF66_9GAST|nr:Pol polyprotein [Elysia marginata]